VKHSCLPHLQLLLLLALHRRGPLCGYGLQKLLQSLGVDVRDAAVYKAITLLEKRGLVEVAEQGPRGRKRYRLTRRGLEEMANLLDEAELLHQALSLLKSLAPESRGGGASTSGQAGNPSGGRGSGG